MPLRPVRALAGAAAVTVTVAGLVVAGTHDGYPVDRPHLLSGSAWVASSQVGQLTLLDGASAEVAARVRVADARHRLDVVQQDTDAYVVDGTAGTIRRVDGATSAVTPPASPITDAGTGLAAYASAQTLYTLDGLRGLATETDPRALTPRGPVLTLDAQVSPQAAALDRHGRLWVLDNTSGELVWLYHGRRSSRPLLAPSSSAVLTLAGDTPIVVDPGRRTASVLDPDSGTVRHTLELDLRPQDRIQVSGSPHDPRFYVVIDRGVLAVCTLTAGACDRVVPLHADAELGRAVESGDRVFVPDYRSGQVWIIDLASARVVAQPQVLAPGTRFELLSRDGLVFFNDPESAHAGVLTLNGSVRPIPKYDLGEPGKGLSTPSTPPQSAPAPASPSPAPAPPPPYGAGIDITVSDNVVHVGDRVGLKVVGTGGARPLDATWALGDGQTGAGLATEHRYTTAGTYHVSATATLAGGGTAAASRSIQVTDRPRLTVQVTGGGRVTGAGLNCSDTCSVAVDAGHPVRLTATQDDGSAFTGWGGPCGGTGTCDLVVSGDVTVTAGFQAAVAASVRAIKGSYTGPCPPPSDATTYAATISVPVGPVTVQFHWTAGDQSVQTVVFSGTGAQSRTVQHNVSTFMSGGTVTDSVAVQVTSPTGLRSNSVGYKLTCQAPAPPRITSVALTLSTRSYNGACPPPDGTFVATATVSVSAGPVTVNVTFDDGLTILYTLKFTGTGPDTKSVSHKVFTNTPGDPGTFDRSITATASGPNLVQSNTVTYRVTCT